MLFKYVAAVEVLARSDVESAVPSAFQPVVFMKVTDVSPVQPLNAEPPMVVTLSGITTEVSEVHLENAPSPILVTLSGIVTEVSEVQPRNAYEPMLVTLSGIVMLVSPVQPSNANKPMFIPPVITTAFKDDGT